MPTLEFSTPADVTPRIAQVRQAAVDSVKAMRLLLDNEPDALQALRILKFEEFGHRPLEPRRLNLMEQLNQSFTYLVSLEAARWLLAKHPMAGPIRLNLGTANGLDLESVAPGQIAAESFAATRPQSNRKLTKDLDRLHRLGPSVAHRYVFLSCPNIGEGRQMNLERGDGVEVWSFPVEKVLGEHT